MNFDLTSAGEQRLLDLHELDEIRMNAYNSASTYKDRSKKYHDARLETRDFKERDKVLLYNSILKLFPGKLKSRWSSPFVILKVFPHDAVEIWSEDSGKSKVNGHKLKKYCDGDSRGTFAVVDLLDPH